MQNESSPNFSIFCPEFCPEFCSEFSPNFLRSFRASFRWKRTPEKIHQKSPPFFNAKFPGKYEKKVHKMFLESGQSNDLGRIFYFGLANFRKIASEFLSEFRWRVLIANFSALFSRFQAPLKFTPKIHAQTCRHSSPIHFLEHKMFSRRFSAGGDQRNVFFWPLS